MAEDLLRYDLLTQNALRGVIRDALKVAQKNGAAPGEHHFYITFVTHAPGVQIAPHLREDYPDDMTIVLQHRFWDLEVDYERFSVLLTFHKKPERLVIPFNAITRFFDPSVQFGLKFDLPDAEEEEDGDTTPSEETASEASEHEPHPERTGDADVVSLDKFRKK
ncbi:MAG: ClpXP protease specificity-enhancing factor SspB [Pseudomonadota bacterium]